jgi:hypothetical protein
VPGAAGLIVVVAVTVCVVPLGEVAVIFAEVLVDKFETVIVRLVIAGAACPLPPVGVGEGVGEGLGVGMFVVG